MFQEIRGVQQRRTDGARKRWFQDPYFDLFVVQDMLGRPQWFQLCYLRDTRRERALEWKRGRGLLHLKVEQPSYAADRAAGALALDGVMPHHEVLARFAAAAGGLPAAIAAFVERKVREHERPSHRFRRPSARTPRWLERLRKRTL
jgi:hypothetical protein